MIAKSEPVRAFLPWLGYVFLDESHHFLVFLVPSALVPEAQYHTGAFGGGLGGEGHHLIHIAGELSLCIAFVGMEGELYLVGEGVEEFHGTVQEGSIRGKHRLESFLACRCDKLWQQGMEQGLTHQMEIKETDLSTDLVGEQVEFLCTQLSLFPGVLGTEVTVEITGICDFYVTTINHSFFVFSLLFFISFFMSGLLFSLFFSFW